MTNKLLIGSLLTLASITPLLTSASSNSASVNYSCGSTTNCVNGMEFGEVDISTLDGYIEDSLNTVCYELKLNSSTNLNSFQRGITNLNMGFDSYYVNGDNSVVVSQCDGMLSPMAGPVIIDNMSLGDGDASASFTITYSLPAGDSGSSGGGDLRGEESYNGFVGSMGNVSGNLSSSIVSFMRVILPYAVGIIALLGLFRYIRNKSKKAVKIGGSGKSAVSGYTRNRANLGQYKLRRKRLINKRRFN